MNEGSGELPKNRSERPAIRMTRSQFEKITDYDFETPESLAVLTELGITIEEGEEYKSVLINVDGDVKRMCVNRNDFGTVKTF